MEERVLEGKSAQGPRDCPMAQRAGGADRVGVQPWVSRGGLATAHSEALGVTQGWSPDSRVAIAPLNHSLWEKASLA